MRRRLRHLRDESGQTMMLVVFAIALVSVLAVGLVDLVTSEAQASGHAASSDSAYQAAEAGIDSYASKLLDDHLYFLHYVADGESTRVSGSLVAAPGDAWTGGITWSYSFGKDNWKPLGNGYAYNLQIVGPSGAATPQQQSIQIIATGCRWDATLNQCGSAANSVRRSIQTLLLPSSVANFQMIANRAIVYGSAATTNGKIYSTGTITHQGTASGNIYSEVSVSGGVNLIGGATIYTPSSNPTIRSVLPNPIDFSSFLTSITDIKGASLVGGINLDAKIGGSPSAYEVVFNPDGTVTASACTKVGSSDVSQIAPTCGAQSTYPVPSNGAIYADETIIIGGTGAAASTVNGRVTVTSNNNIVIGNNISYQAGTYSVLGLVALNNMIVAYWAPSNLSWTAATIASTGQWTDTCGAFSYQCGTHGTMTFTGSTATNNGGSMSMFTTRVYDYDPNLLWLLPPWFPTVDKPYSVLMQREITPP
jgi:hypothetical protein